MGINNNRDFRRQCTIIKEETSNSRIIVDITIRHPIITSRTKEDTVTAMATEVDGSTNPVQTPGKATEIIMGVVKAVRTIRPGVAAEGMIDIGLKGESRRW